MYSSQVTVDQIEAAKALNEKVLKELYPDVDVSDLSAVSSILVNGTANIVAAALAQGVESSRRVDLRGIAAGTVTVSDAVMDDLASTYFTSRRTSTAAYGDVFVIVGAPTASYALSAGTVLKHGNLLYRTTTSVQAYPAGTSGIDFARDTVRAIVPFYDQSSLVWGFTVPVQSDLADPVCIRTVGDRLSFVSALTNISGAVASSIFLGGYPQETNAELATRLLSGIAPRTVAGQSVTEALARTLYPQVSVAQVGFSSVLQTRDRANVFGLPTGGKTDVYVKVGPVASKGYVGYAATVVDVGTRTLRIILAREDAAGWYDLALHALYPSPAPAIVSGGLAVTAITPVQETLSGFNPAIGDARDLRGSARATVQITFTDTRQTSSGHYLTLTAPGQVLSGHYGISLRFQPGLVELDRLLTSGENRPAGADVLVKAAVPCLTSISLTVASASAPISASALAEFIHSQIRQLPVGVGSISLADVNNWVATYYSTAAVTAISGSGTILCPDATSVAISFVGGVMAIPTDAAKKIGPENVFFSSDPSQITVVAASGTTVTA